MLDLQSLFKLSYGMYIVTSKKPAATVRQHGEDGKFNGCIVNTVFQLTPEPPMIAVSVNRECLTHQYITSSKIFSVSVLSQDTPLPFIGRFGFNSGKNINKFEKVKYKIGQTGAPIILDNTLASVEVEVTESIDIFTHTLFIGKVVACEILADKEPMTYAYYRDIKRGKTPKTAATYIKVEPKKETKEGIKKMKKYECTVCGYIYDPAVGDPDNGVEPGTAFEDLPDDWVCPECGADKDKFEPVEEEE